MGKIRHVSSVGILAFLRIVRTSFPPLILLLLLLCFIASFVIAFVPHRHHHYHDHHYHYHHIIGHRTMNRVSGFASKQITRCGNIPCYLKNQNSITSNMNSCCRLFSSSSSEDSVVAASLSSSSSPSNKIVRKRKPKVASTEMNTNDTTKKKTVAPSKGKPKQKSATTTTTTSSNITTSEFFLETLNAPRLHEETKDWILFSDLHVKMSSIKTCEEVLDIVNAEASKRSAGIIFLGDFWHVRGALNVELLNRVLRSLKKWKVPVIMIPGNHDQVTLGGAIHSLEPLQYAFAKDQILMISEPCICLGALWIPYRRDHYLMKSILAQGLQRQDFNVIFCHADVQGAFMNDGMKSREGLSVDVFPHNKAVYSGHFHKPHTMKRNKSSLQYLGSPYQTSLSEAGQEKYLYCMSSFSDSASPPSSSNEPENRERCWVEVERWPIRVGRKYYKAASFDDPILGKARAGDRVVVQVGKNESYSKIFEELRAQGIEIELRMQGRSSIIPTKKALKGLGTEIDLPEEVDDNCSPQNEGNKISEFKEPICVFEDFMSLESVREAIEKSVASLSPRTITTAVNADISSTCMNELSPVNSTNITNSTNGTNSTSSSSHSLSLPINNLYGMIIEEGKNTLERIASGVTGTSESTAATTGGLSATAVGSGKVRDLRLDHVRLKNFGPYGGEEIKYPLSNRGLVLLRGQSNDGTGADSNGAGKTTLAVSVMWALTGSMDARLITDGKAVNVAYDSVNKVGKRKEKNIAEVVLEGEINQNPFRIERRRGKSKVELLFFVNGTDLSQQSVKDTQAIIDEELGVGAGLLQRCCFYGQHSHTLQSLLGLTDVKFKSEMSLLVDTGPWTSALQDIKSRDKEYKARISEIRVEMRMREEEVHRIRQSVKEAMVGYRAIERNHEEAVMSLNDEISEMKSKMSEGIKSPSEIRKAIDLCKTNESKYRNQVLEPIEQESLKFRKKRSDIQKDADESLLKLKSQVAVVQASLPSLSTSSQNAIRKREILKKNITQTETALSTSVNKYHEVMGLSASSSVWSTPLGEEDMKVLVEWTTEGIQSIGERYDDTLRQYASIDSAVRETNKSIAAIHASSDLNHPTESSKSSKEDDGVDDNCPVCGQPFLAHSRDDREVELKEKLEKLKINLVSSRHERNALKGGIDELRILKKLVEQIHTLECHLAEVEKEIATNEEMNSSQLIEATRLKKLLQEELDKRKRVDLELEVQDQTLLDELRSAQQKSHQFRADIEDLQIQLDNSREIEILSKNLETKSNAEVESLQNRLNDSRSGLSKQSTTLFDLEKKIKDGEKERQSLIDKSIVLGELASIFGPRGIQHFLFAEAIKSLESISNSYLDVLAEGGIQLSLQSDEDADKIVKSVLIRTSDGMFRERALSQLSGGQWRRVSMALDFAFAEVIRRKGTLRCNFIVMDEILTHLDASGRESVGTVLRALVAKRTSGEAETVETSESDVGSVTETEEWAQLLLGGGRYETVLIILQDLAATELEEAFDHIDVVVKESDTSKVIIDGQKSN